VPHYSRQTFHFPHGHGSALPGREKNLRSRRQSDKEERI
jgi:hypothetical protein